MMKRASGRNDREPTTRERLSIRHTELATAQWGEGAPELILLHDGLGSIEQFRQFPAELADATGRTVLAYDRAGHGSSGPVPKGPWPADWLDEEATVLADLIRHVEADDPMLVGHSDGGSIAAIHAASDPVRSPLVLLAAHSWVEPMTSAEISRMRENGRAITTSLSRFHEHAEELFEAWSGAWVGTEFAEWDIRSLLRKITAPTLVIQGSDDEYASPEHATATAQAIGPRAEALLLPNFGHLLHHGDSQMLARTIADFDGRTHSTFT